MLLDFLLLILIYRRLAAVSVFTPAATDESRALAAEYSNLRPISAPKFDSREIVVMKLLTRIGSHMMENPADYPELTEAVQRPCPHPAAAQAALDKPRRTKERGVCANRWNVAGFSGIR
jgi:hypothetical protein